MDRLTEMKAFIAVADAGGFSAAARQTGMLQPAVSKAVGALEKRLGIALLHRSTRRVAVTEHGRRYYERIKPLIDALSEAETEAITSTQGVSGFVRIGAPATFGRLHVLPLIPTLLALHPGLQVDLVLSDFMRDMVEDGIDLAIRVGATRERNAVVRQVAGTRTVCVGSRRYFEERGIPRTPDDLAHHNCLLFGQQRESQEWPLIDSDGKEGVKVRGSLSSNSVETIRTGVLAGVGIGLMTQASLSSELARPDIITILEQFVPSVRAVSLVWPKRRFVAARVRRTTDFFATALAERLVESVEPSTGSRSSRAP
jgi:DNA-binding transcriptional LysR family regulator